MQHLGREALRCSRVIKSPRTGRVMSRINALPPSDCDLTQLDAAPRAAWHRVESAPRALAFAARYRDQRAPHWTARLQLQQMYAAQSKMSLLDTDTARLLFRAVGLRNPATLLDVGAGPGHITLQLSPLFQRVSATEQSWPCARALRRLGFEVAHGPDIGFARGRTFDVVSLLNVLDRCADADGLLKQCAGRLANAESRLVVALRLPVDAYQLHWNDTATPQSAPLPASVLAAETWEAGANAFARHVSCVTGLKLEVLSRIPYLALAQGPDRPNDLFYALDDAVFIFKPEASA
ncbi:DREV methyltransferase-domain-containing protein [Pelagophyceae sp. CCMP2097]|nr:DREV methyltransferase-domain-containing protein [Pelagophyceae sp. CCMP2097]